jgi:hypothetical protein
VETNNIVNPNQLDKIDNSLFAKQSPDLVSIGEFRNISRSNFSNFIRKFSKNYFAVIGVILFVSILLLSIILPLASPYQANQVLSAAQLDFIGSLPPISSENQIVNIVLTSDNLVQLDGLNIKYDTEVLSPGKFIVSFALSDYFDAINFDRIKPILGTTPEG